MAKYTGPKAKLIRREGVDLGLKSGVRPIRDKCRFESKPGKMASSVASKATDYGNQLREKQRVRRTYGVLERQFKRYFELAKKKKGSAGLNLLLILETRLDNVVYRLGFASTRAEARQMVSHKLITVNGKVVNIPSYLTNVGDVIAVREKAKSHIRILSAIKFAAENGFPQWVQVETEKFEGSYLRLPEKDEFAVDVNESLIVELFSR